MMKRVLSLILVLSLVFSCVPGVSAVVNLTDNSAVQQNELESVAGTAEAPAADEAEATSEDLGLTKFESSEWERFSKNEVANTPEADDVVTFIVVLEEKPQLELYSVKEIANQTASVQSHAKKQENVLNAVKNSVQNAFGKQEGFKLGFTYTIATTGFSVSTAYGNKAAIESMEGVKNVYVAATFNLPENQDFKKFTNNSSTMIGANVANESGYTGKGMRVAILDTGIMTAHPNFQALPDEVLVDPMTRESVNEIWSTLNAGQMTSLLNTSYYSSKIPFAFNYNAGNFNVENSYAGSDHGTHVAGIAAANKIEGSNVIGVAPDAQLVVMQVFQNGGGASWAVIMAALEDCVRLEVDAANLSLGSPAGFVDPEDEMLDTLNLFLDTDIQVLIASGNDTHNAFMNRWGGDMSLIENPDIGLASTPSTYSAALAVASMDNNGYEQMYITVGGKEIGFQDTAATSHTSFIVNFRNRELEYVVVPGIGEEADYENLDVTGKVALVQRGTLSFPEKQAIAQEKGAIGVIVYNNTIGFFGMQINDGEGNIPAVSISKAGGLHMIEQAGEAGIGTLTVCDADMKLFQVDTSLSDFSTWGVAPDMTLKPEIAGVGGSVYATRDPSIAGSNYGYMSGTSMATPQVTGAMAVIIQYLDENFPNLTGAEQRRVAAALAMSTANPILATDDLEYSPRGQGAGLIDLVKATTTAAYLTNPKASEGRPKAELGDNDSKSGVFSFTFEINNLTAEELVYEISSSIFSESIYANYFIANSPYALEAEVAVDGPITVPAGGKATVKATISLTENDKAYLNRFPNGIWVEGFLYATPVENAEGAEPVVLSMPILGFYGDWSDAPVFDSQDTDSYSLYPAVMYTYGSQLGYNPYFRTGAYGEKYNAFSYSNPIDEIDFGMLRNAKRLDIKVTDKVTGEEYHYLEGVYMPKTYFNTSYGMIVPTMILGSYGETWDGKTPDGKSLPDGTVVTYSFEAWLDDGDDVMDDRWSFDMTLDTLAPEVLNEDDLQESLRFEGERTFLSLEMQDNHYIAALIFQSPEGAIMGKYEIGNEPGESVTGEYEITGFGSEFTIIVADYACNENEIEVLLDLGDQNNAVPGPAALSKDRLYGCETFDGAIIEAGWFSANKSDFSGARNETFNSANRYYSAEYVNGYLVAQSTTTGHLELITPSGSYWSSKVLTENRGGIGDQGVWVLYDMALDHSGKLLESYGVYGNDGTDGLFAVGWMYAGDTDNDGHDDGYNALFAITFSNGYVNVNEVGRIAGVPEGDLLTLGITTEGEIYGIDTNAVLYALDKTRTWDDNVGDYGDYVVNCNKIAETSFVDYPNYAGANVIQSMGYDHNTGTMYWYAHTQVPVSYYYENVNITYSVNLETAECTEIGTYGPGGLTCLFVPNDLESDLFSMGVEVTGMSINPSSIYMLEGQTKRMKIDWEPWNAAPVAVTWASLDESVATVDEYGYVTAVGAGEVTITASAEMMLDGYWEVTDAGDWIWHDPAPGVKTVQATVTVVRSEGGLYGYAMEDNGNPANSFSWITYSDKDLYDVTVIGKSMLPGVDAEGNEVMTEAMWAGGTYYNGYLWTTTSASWQEEDVIYVGTQLYKSKVTRGATPAETTIGEPELVGVIPDMEITAMGFDYNTGRMYCVENKYVGGLGIIDLETAEVDMLGLPNGDLAGATYIPALCVAGDGTIVISDAVANLYIIDPDTLTTRKIYSGNGSASTAFYEAMAYDHETGSIYWNMCDGNYASPLYLVMLPEYEWEQATLVDLGGVSTKVHVQQTVLFTLPETEPETNVLPVESIEITNGERLVGLEGGSMKLNTVTVPARPTIQKKTWTSSDESVVTVDAYGTMTYVGIGTATVTVSITNKDEATYGGPFTDSIEITVKEAAGQFVAFLNSDEGGSQYYDFWLKGNDYDLRHTAVGQSMIAIYSLRSGTYYDGYFYGYNDKGEFMRISMQDPANYKILGKADLDYTKYQVTALAMDYTTGTMYALTLPSNYSFDTLSSEQHPGELVTVNLDNGQLTTVATLDFETPVYALACDANGQLYAAGGSFDMYADSTTIYKLDKANGQLAEYVVVEGAGVFTGANYYGSVQYNSQMTYDWGTNRLYLNATVDDQYYYTSHGMFMIELGEEPTASYLDGISLDFGRGDPKIGQVYLGLLAFIPEADEIPVAKVNGIMLNTTSVRMDMGTTIQIVAQVRPSNAADKSLTWVSADENVATVDENGLITAVSEGKTIVTVTSNETGISNVISVTVVDAGGVQSIAYTASAQKDALISFNPNLPGQTAEVIATLSGGGNIKGMAMGDNCLYFVMTENYNHYLYRFDFTTKQVSPMGQLYTFSDPTGLAYDAQNGLFYVTAGFYIFLFQESALDPAGFNYYANYVMDSDYCMLTGVSVIDGAVYTFGNDYYTSLPKMMRYSDMYLSDRTVMLDAFDMTFVAGATDIAYDPMTKQFYMTDAGHNIFAMDLAGNVEQIGLLGDGIDLNGLGIYGVDPEGLEFTVKFNAQGGQVDPESITAVYGQPIGELPVPTRKYYEFAGWFDANGNEITAETVYAKAGNMHLYAKWNELPVTFHSITATLGGDIGMNFYVRLADEILNDPAAVMQFNVNGKLINVPMSEAVAAPKYGEKVYRFTCYLNAKQMADVVAAQIVTSEGNVGITKTMTLETYCNWIIANYQDAEVVALMKSMLNYGAAAQTMFSYNTDNLANAALSEADKVLADVDASAYVHAISGAEDGIKIASTTLLLDSTTTLRIYFQLTGEKTIDQFTFIVDGQEVTPIQKGERYYVQISNIAAHKLDTFHEFTVGGLSMSYSALSYVNTVLNVSNDEAVVNMAKALYIYAMAAEAYAG